MPTNVRTGDKDLVTQYAKGTVFQPADPVFLKPKGDPGVAPHFNISTTINNAAGTVFNKNTKVATKDSYLGAGKHAPIVIAGRNTGQVNGDNGFMSWMKNVYIEGRNAVMHGVQTSVNALWSMLPPALKMAVQNGTQIAQGMTAQDFGDAASEEAAALMDALLSTDTLIALAQTAALMGLSAVPVVGQLAGGAAAVQRLKAAVDSVDGAADQLTEMMERWSKPMSPAQIAAERKKLAAFLIVVGASAILAALGKAMPKLSGKSKGKQNSEKDVVVGTKAKPKQTTCACATGRPVIIATGEKSLSEKDFELPGLIALDWTRSYRSGDVRPSWFGQGWSTPLAVELRLASDGITYHDASGRAVLLPFIATGSEHFDAYEEFTLRRPTNDRWEIAFKHGLTERFERVRDDLFVLPLSNIVDRNGNRIGFEYPEPPEDPFAPWRPRVIVDSAGRRLRLEWNRRGLLMAVLCQADPVAPPLTLASYAYSEDGDLAIHTDAAGAQRSYEWRNNVLVAYTTADGARYCAEYDEYSPFGRVLRSYAEEDGRGLRFDYDDRARTTRITDALGRSTVYEYDERKDIVATTEPDGIRVETPSDANGNPRGPVDPLGRQTHYRFDERGNLTEVVNAAGARTAIDYNDLDLPVKYIDALNHAWLSEYDARGNLVEAIDPLDQATRYNYDERGQVIAIMDARGGIKRIKWDNAGNLTCFTDCSGQQIRFRYDAYGRLVERLDALGNTAKYEWSHTGRIVSITEPGGAAHRYEWSFEGRLLAYIDPLGAITRYRYNLHGEPVKRVDPNGNTLRYDFDLAGRLVSLTNENGNISRFTYDSANRLTDEIGFDGRYQRYCYNSAGELTHLIESGGSDYGPGKVTQFERDVVGRLVRKTAEGDDDCQSVFTYNALGRLLTAENSAAKIQFTYDPLGQLLTETQRLTGGVPKLLKHEYDVLGNRVRTTLPDGQNINWLFYGSGHLHQISLERDGRYDVVSDIERDKLHREIVRTQGALQSQYDYDPMGRLTRHRTDISNRSAHMSETYSSRAQVDRRYHYDLAGKLLSTIDAVRGEKTYEYDPARRIRAAHGHDQELFAFDPAGNLQTAQAVYERGNRILVYQDVRYRYDEHGNVTSRLKGAHEEAEYVWNGFNQLKQASVTRRGVKQTTCYEYDALNRRTRKRDQFGATEYLWDGHLTIESRRGGNASLFIFEPETFVPVATIQNGQKYWYHCDQVGAPLELTNLNGAVVWAADYTVWGKTKPRKYGTNFAQADSRTIEAADEVVQQPIRLQGQWFDDETGLHYNRFRYYDPDGARYISQDPIGLAGGINEYSYVSDPLTFIDPFGLAPKPPSKFALPDGSGATPADIAASKTNGGSRSGQTACRDKLLAAAKAQGGVYKCWRCGQTSTNPSDMHLGHKNVPTSKGGNLADVNIDLEGASCNLSAGNSGHAKEGMSCVERGSCGAPYGR